ncbi:MAG TPA: TetR/AcrR family transcriptional regulator [Acidimicrobiales bacterium]
MLTGGYILCGIPVQTKLLPRAERRASILQGAAAAFARSGFAHTSMEDVASACGVTKLILYRHFETKEELYRAILQRVFDRLGQELDAGIKAGSLRGLGARTQLRVAREDPDSYTLLWRHAAREPMFAAYAAEARAICIEVVRQMSRFDSADAVVDHWQAEVLFSYLVDATLTWLDNGDPSRDEYIVGRTTVGLHALRDAWAPALNPA